MKITQEVRDYAKKKGLEEKEALAEGMKEMSQTFKDKGSQIYSEPATQEDQ